MRYIALYNSLGHVANRPDYHVNLMLTYRFFFDNLRPQSYLKASVFFLGEAILTKAWTEDPRVAKVYIFCRKSHHIWKERGSHSEAETLQGVPEVHASFSLIKYFILVVPSFDSNIRFVYLTSSAHARVFFPATFCFWFCSPNFWNSFWSLFSVN